jgi:hypothetical protein
MKRILLLLAIALLFIACKKDASQIAKPPVSEIIGNWQHIHIVPTMVKRLV